MRKPLASFLVGVLAVSLLALSHTSAPTASAATIAPTTSCSNGVDDTPGLGLICGVTIVNTITASGGSASVTVRECHGAAGDPTAACTVDTQTLTAPVTQVTQCNASTNGGGGTLRCSVDVTNNFVGVTGTTSAVTVNQCVGSGDGIANTCDPFPSTTSGATVTQCNGSANGGTLVELTCTATGTTSSGLDVEVDQCNGSTNGGGALVICSVVMRNTFAAGPTASPSAPTASASAPTATGTPTTTIPVGNGSTSGRGVPTAPPTSVASEGRLDQPSSTGIVLFGLTILALGGMLVATSQRVRL